MHPGRELPRRADDFSCEDDLYPGTAAPVGLRLPEQPGATDNDADNSDEQRPGHVAPLSLRPAHPASELGISHGCS